MDGGTSPQEKKFEPLANTKAGKEALKDADFKNSAPNHPDYKAPKNWNGKKVKNPNGKGSGFPDKNGDVWIPQNHKGTHGNHWDVQMKHGKYRTVYPLN